MQLELLGDSIFDQILTAIIPTDWKVIVARNIGLPVTSATAVTYGQIVNQLHAVYTTDTNNASVSAPILNAGQTLDDVIAADMMTSTGQTEAIARAMIDQEHKHEATGQWTLSPGLSDPNAVTVPGLDASMKTIKTVAVAGAVIVAGYFALQVIGFIPKPGR